MRKLIPSFFFNTGAKRKLSDTETKSADIRAEERPAKRARLPPTAECEKCKAGLPGHISHILNSS